MTIDACFQIAYVARTHGLKGEVTVVLDPDCPDLLSLKSVFLEIKGQLVPYFVESVSQKGPKAYLKLEGINDAHRAEALTSAGIFIPKSQRPQLPRGKFYNDEVVAFNVVDKSAGALGTVKEVLDLGSNRQLVVAYAGRELLIPLNGPFIRGVNKTRKEITVELPDGFLEL